MNDQTNSRRLAAIMFTDIVAYSELMGRNESAAMNLLDRKEKILLPIIDEFNGKTIKNMGGDGFLIEFASAVDAVRCGIMVQKTISELNNTENDDDKIIIRIGIHLGDVVIRKDDIYGNDVNIAKRVESLADPGGISISEVVYDQIKNNVEIQTVEVGEKELKNIKDNVNIYKVLLEAQKIENDDSDILKNVGMSSKSIDSYDTEDMPIPEKVVINDGDEKIDINIDKEGKEVTINVEKKDKKTSDRQKKEQVKIGLSGIHVKDGDDEVTIGPGGIKVKEKDGDDIEIGLSGIKINKERKNQTSPKKTISNFRKAIIKLIGGIAFLVFITGIVTDLYGFWYGVIGFLGVGILSASLKALFGMKDK